MNKKFLSKITVASIITASIIFTGCGDKTTSKAKVIENKPTIIKNEKVASVPSEKKEEVKKIDAPIYTKYDSVVQNVFKDVAKIAPDGKQMIIVFGTNTDPYSDRLKADIKDSADLQKRLKEEFSSYYLRAHENLRHKQYHEGELMDVDTKTMIVVYGIESTPTIIFTDDNGKAVLVVPGYIPAKQFLVTMDFMSEGKWKGKNRKNGEIYEALRTFYIENGIDVIKKKAE
ncbi:MAG: phosphoribosylformylglycinamidine cyclo-ligase [Arcobacter sp.]|nr:MAG: phosphoribosylformylglycinamidine cyclo-ligase [Arcobacter sp.]